jgi:hypothetical protein
LDGAPLLAPLLATPKPAGANPPTLAPYLRPLPWLILPLEIYPNRFCPAQFTPPDFTLADLTQQKTIQMHPENILHQTDDTQWEVRTPKGDLLACITFDPESGNYNVSEGLDLESEFFGSRIEAFHYAMTGAEL